jgi:hypothetical protein
MTDLSDPSSTYEAAIELVCDAQEQAFRIWDCNDVDSRVAFVETVGRVYVEAVPIDLASVLADDGIRGVWKSRCEVLAAE